MVRTLAKSHHNEVEDEDGDELAPGSDGPSQRDGKGIEQKANNSRSKHSETEQRRRSKINERFQILRDLIPPNEQKRDKASLLLEVIEYIQFLQERLNMYEGSYQGWNQEPTKLIPWRGNHGPGETLADHSQVMKSCSGQDNNVVQSIANAPNLVEPNFSADAAYRVTEHPCGEATSATPLIPPLYVSGRSIVPVDNFTSQPQSQPWLGGASSMDCVNSGNIPCEASSSDISSAYSRGLLKNLTQAFQTSGVDLSQANISVQLDIGKRANVSLSAARPSREDTVEVAMSNQSMAHPGPQGGNGDSNPAAKRPRTGES